MSIDFGSIKRYYSARGFGFVGHSFSNSNREVFFHIKQIKSNYYTLAKKLDSGEELERISFWYKVKTTDKGESASKIWLSAKDIPSTYKADLHTAIERVEDIWQNISSTKPDWLDAVTIELVGTERRQELSIIRHNLESLHRVEKQQLIEEQILQESEIRRIVQSHDLNLEEAKELHQLLQEMRPLKFTHSKQLSRYIVDKKLGYKYQNISGIVKMRELNTEWNFHGGFPAYIYKIICIELRLANQRTPAKPIRFTSFKALRGQ